jgi:hypothetical protein
MFRDWYYIISEDTYKEDPPGRTDIIREGATARNRLWVGSFRLLERQASPPPPPLRRPGGRGPGGPGGSQVDFRACRRCRSCSVTNALRSLRSECDSS